MLYKQQKIGQIFTRSYLQADKVYKIALLQQITAKISKFLSSLLQNS